MNNYYCSFVPTEDKADQSLEVQIVGYVVSKLRAPQVKVRYS